ncbi:MAG: ABC-F family ATP-binding cassette domain-containing protein [Gemmatimonadetes bacterium]|jgi:macrolide transport system ATP-binding/permease protein|nr:ABC-F family ATP-binding cassette domain-containing protein [Gemmatimonadota bacterium]MBT7864346.1 ABC-F family ATP-binding cassette domain-containing protein [Gemmatimonadota bacterium]
MLREDILFHGVGFTYEGAITPLFGGVDLHFPTGWSGVVGPNGAGKTTLLMLATGQLRPTEGQVVGGGEPIYCQQRTDDAPEGLHDLLTANDGDSWDIRGRLGIAEDWLGRWPSLSHGERKRAQIGVALWREPVVLAIDEPTNHLDRGARAMLGQALRRFTGIGLLVSHDRELLDDLCQQCAFVEPPQVAMRPGGYTLGAEQGERELATARHARETATKDVRRLEREEHRRRAESARSDARASKKNLGKDNDARFKRNLARMSGKDGQAGRLLNQMGGRAQQAREHRDSIQVAKQHDLGIWLDGAPSPRDRLLWRDAGALPVGGARQLAHPDLVMKPTDRVCLAGPNGAGKSTLLRALLGTDLNVDAERLVYVPQEIDISSAQQILAGARSLPHDQLGKLMTIVSCLNSRPERLLESELPSPGEVRKLLLADGIARQPHLIVMDEPTNHLDLPSIECLEAALRDCPCGLLLVSHDERFLQSLTATRWNLEWAREGGGDAVLHVRQGWEE